jgi:hypothetical protein
MRTPAIAGGTLSLMRRSVMFLMVASIVLLSVAAGASAKPIAVKRCGYTQAKYGRSAVYPWHITCATARSVIAGSDKPHAKTIAFGPAWDGAAVEIKGRYWVCTGQMGYYNCGYPYRPRKVHGQRGYAKPFSEDVEFVTCKKAGAGACGSTFTIPSALFS